jgi:hypothetical protein
MIYRGLGFLVDIRGGTAKQITIYAALPSIADSSCQLSDNLIFIHHMQLFRVAAVSSLIISISILCADQPGITAASVRSSTHLCLVLPGMAAASCLLAVWSSLFHHVCVSSRYSSCQLPDPLYIPSIAAAGCLILSIFTICAAPSCTSIAAGPLHFHHECSL